MTTLTTATPKLLVLGGATGLLGQALVQAATANGYQVIAAKRKDFDINDPKSIAEFVDWHAPDIICNTIAYTQVDKAEEEPKEADALNRRLPLLLGRIVKERPQISLLHISTDFVFNGKKKKPYVETDPTGPLCVYGQSKLDGEKALLDLQLENLCIVRTAWLFGPGRRNFISTILGLCKSGAQPNVVHDQIGSPTYTVDLANYCLHLLKAKATGLFHVANSGQASWCELAAEAVRLMQHECSIIPVPSAGYPQKAVRPAYSVLDCSHFTAVTGIKPRSWSVALTDYLYQAPENG